ncbi:uncharacterized protein LOC110265228 [Arachis ipaensis]|uniref:uncharacterized protein LOC110265228 n=1 Tax=Arachis ipaensis TaxID=130454 RepID=UPI000A2B19C7|nr:uncharacterized protein LOC110265228 [Arachis ipaensis]
MCSDQGRRVGHVESIQATCRILVKNQTQVQYPKIELYVEFEHIAVDGIQHDPEVKDVIAKRILKLPTKPLNLTIYTPNESFTVHSSSPFTLQTFLLSAFIHRILPSSTPLGLPSLSSSSIIVIPILSLLFPSFTRINLILLQRLFLLFKPNTDETGSEDDGLLDLSEDDFFLAWSSSDEADADDEWTDKSTRWVEMFYNLSSYYIMKIHILAAR